MQWGRKSTSPQPENTILKQWKHTIKTSMWHSAVLLYIQTALILGHYQMELQMVVAVGEELYRSCALTNNMMSDREQWGHSLFLRQIIPFQEKPLILPLSSASHIYLRCQGLQLCDLDIVGSDHHLHSQRCCTQSSPLLNSSSEKVFCLSS